jgi:hypothetical protein
MRFCVSFIMILFLCLGSGCNGGSSSGSNKVSSGGSTQNQIDNSVSTTSPTISGCQIFPSDNPWNTDISAYPLDPNSSHYISYILNGQKEHLHPDFGGAGEYGIPYMTVNSSQARYKIIPQYVNESDQDGAYGFFYPIPPDAPVENGSDAHVIALDTDQCKLYELYAASFSNNAWNCGSAAIFDLTSNNLRPDYWTSADAAGLPILPGSVRYEEVAAGEVNHAIRVTFSRTQKGFIHPATHYASNITDANAPPMGLRLRLKADYDLSGITGEAFIIAQALKKYGYLVADNGSDFYFQGSQDVRWDDIDLNQLKTIPGSAFDVVYTGEIHH